MSEKNPFTLSNTPKPDRTGRKVKLLVVSLIFVIFLLLGLLAWALTTRDSSCTTKYASKTDSQKLCLTKECVSIASTMLERMDPSKDPCEDFYGYACGNYIQMQAVPDEYYVKNMLQDIHEGTFLDMRNYLEEPIQPTDERQIIQIKRLYQSCMEETPNQTIDATNSLFKLIHQTTGSEWSLFADPKSEEPNILGELVSREQQIASLFLHQVQPFFQIVVAPDRDRVSYALHILPGSTVLEQLNFNTSKPDGLEQYKSFQKEALKLFEAILDRSGDRAKTRQVLEDMMDFELDLYNITKDLTFERCLTKIPKDRRFQDEFGGIDLCEEKHINPSLFINITLEEMNEEFPEIDWRQMFDYIMNGTEVKLRFVLIHSREYFRSLIRVLALHDTKIIQNYLGWSIAVKYMPYLGPPFKHLMSEFHQKNPVLDPEMNESGNNFKYFHSKWKQCVSIVCEGLKIPSISLYVKKNAKRLEELKTSISSLIEQMKSTFVDMILQQDWIQSSHIRESFQKRISSIKSNIGVPDYCHNQTWIGKNYKNLQIDPELELVSNVFRINIHESGLEMNKVHQATVRDNDWIFQPLDVNAFYDFNSNEIIIPLGIMRPPLLYENIPKYLQMSFFGMVIGHEIAHSLEIQSKKYLLNNFETKTHKSHFSVVRQNDTFNELYKKKATCFTERFSKFHLEDIDDYVNGNQTLEENLCDFASFQQAFSIYKKIPAVENERLPGFDKLTVDQVFMLHFGQLWCETVTKEGHQKSLLDPHAPGKFRANGVVMNSKAFAEIFQCSPKSAMNPQQKCDLWSMNY